MDKREEIVEVMARAIYDCADKSDGYVGDYQFHGYGDDAPPETCLDGDFDLAAFARAALSALEQKGYAIVPVLSSFRGGK